MTDRSRKTDLPDAAVATRIVGLGGRVLLRRATENDIAKVYEWQCRPATRRFANTSEAPEWKSHCNWMRAKLASSACNFYIIEYEGAGVGVLRLDDVPDEEATLLVSIFVIEEHFGKGIASAALDLARQHHPQSDLLAQVLDENTASIALFERNGYKLIKPQWYIRLAEPRDLAASNAQTNGN